MNIDLTLSPETEALLGALKNVPMRGEVSYASLSACIGRRVDGPARNALASARRIALRDSGICFTILRGVGLRRIAPEEAAQIGQVARGSIRSKARRASRAIKSVVAASNGVSPDVQRRIGAEVAALGLIGEIAGEPAQKAFETSGPAMPPALASAAFMRHIGARIDTEEQTHAH